MIKNYVKNKKVRAALSIESDMMQRVPEVCNFCALIVLRGLTIANLPFSTVPFPVLPRRFRNACMTAREVWTLIKHNSA